MPKYLLKVSYTIQGIQGVRKEGGTMRRDAAAKLCESVGGTLESMYFAFGTTDVYATADLPDNVAAANVATAEGGKRPATAPLPSRPEVARPQLRTRPSEVMTRACSGPAARVSAVARAAGQDKKVAARATTAVFIVIRPRSVSATPCVSKPPAAA